MTRRLLVQSLGVSRILGLHGLPQCPHSLEGVGKQQQQLQTVPQCAVCLKCTSGLLYDLIDDHWKRKLQRQSRHLFKALKFGQLPFAHFCKSTLIIIINCFQYLSLCHNDVRLALFLVDLRLLAFYLLSVLLVKGHVKHGTKTRIFSF